MPAHTSSTLYRIDECPDVMADACVGDDQGNLIFLSIWARDTAVQQFLARLTLRRDRQGPPARPPVDAGAGHLPIAAARPLARDRAGTAAKPRDAGPPSVRPRAAGRPSASHRRAGADLGAGFADPQ